MLSQKICPTCKIRERIAYPNGDYHRDIHKLLKGGLK